METISARELERCAQAGTFLIIDLRSREEYARGHVPGAVNVPQGEFGTELAGREQETIVLYCSRGALSMAVARRLEQEGYRARSVIGGIRAYRGNLELQRNKI